ncbi:MAG TPA: phosphatase PAP2 family protein, partial [Phenylobacterium sp.]
MSSPAAAVAPQVEKLDIEVGERLARKRNRPGVKAVAKAGKLGDQEPLYALSAVVCAAGLFTHRPRLAEMGLRMGLAVGAADLMKSALKKTVTRTRPHILLDEGRYEAEPGGSDEKPEQSFPSGHMACTTAAALAAGRLYPAT